MSSKRFFRPFPHLTMARLVVEAHRRRVECVPGSDRRNERGSGTVEWLGISALSIGLLVGLFAGLEQIGEAVLSAIRSSLGL